ncbi:hypothetical protein TRN7648_00005 [Tropicibacter naphthalenivorans]|uniref:Uncharacterized protein n=1 Tax=Tropicibacter naphthalenivorans TaxID=441103 RepID=A0A0P1FZ84_9RHOB|nr:hypothetical protein TRN7648_00005 [Tropicibacter naphthalenivorans]
MVKGCAMSDFGDLVRVCYQYAESSAIAQGDRDTCDDGAFDPVIYRPELPRSDGLR